MDKQVFKKLVIDEVTEFGSLPMKIKETSLDSMITTCAMWFYRKWEGAQQEQYIIISKAMLGTPLFKENRQIVLPSCVRYIYELKECGGNYWTNDINPDFRKTQLNYSTFAVNGNSDTLLTAVTYAYFVDKIQEFVIRTLAYNWNENTHKLFIAGRNLLYADLVARAMVDIPLEDLMNSEMFLRYVVGRCRKSLATVFNLTDFKMIGGASLKFSDILAQGKEDIADVEKDIEDDDSGAAFMIIGDQFVG